MSTIMMERPATVTAEHNHSCTSQCAQPCEAARNAVTRPEVDIVASPELTVSAL